MVGRLSLLLRLRISHCTSRWWLQYRQWLICPSFTLNRHISGPLPGLGVGESRSGPCPASLVLEQRRPLVMHRGRMIVSGWRWVQRLGYMMCGSGNGIFGRGISMVLDVISGPHHYLLSTCSPTTVASEDLDSFSLEDLRWFVLDSRGAR